MISVQDRLGGITNLTEIIISDKNNWILQNYKGNKQYKQNQKILKYLLLI